MRTKITIAMAFVLLVAFLPATAASQPDSPRDTENTTDKTAADWVGASIVHPEDWEVERERTTSDETLGFVLYDPERGTKDHGGEPEVL